MYTQILSVITHIFELKEWKFNPIVVLTEKEAPAHWEALFGSDAAKATGSGQPTWGPFRWGPRVLRIDHAFVSGVEPAATSIAKVRGTDHRALIVDIKVAD